MNATEILWGQVLLVAAAVLGFVWAATEWTAWKLVFRRSSATMASAAPVHRNVGSSRSRTQSPIRLTDSVHSDRTMPGSTAIHQALPR
jgi:hypothetical protein